MIKNFTDLMNAKGFVLTEPIGFGKFKGKRIDKIPESYWKILLSKNHVSWDKFRFKLDEAKQYISIKENRPERKPALICKTRSWLYKHQKRFILKFRNDNYGGLWADIGTGKTFAMLEMIRQRINPAHDKVLILCPKAVFTSWVDAISFYFDNRAKSIVLTGKRSGNVTKEKILRLSLQSHFYITNYETLLKDEIVDVMVEKGFTWIVADEAHKYFCNTKTKTYKNAMDLSSGIEMRYLLTGTPRRSKDENLYGLITFLDRGARFGLSFYTFKKLYFEALEKFPGDEFPDYELRGSKRDDFISKVSSCSFQVNKRDVLDLPPVTKEIRQVELTGDAQEAYEKMLKDSIIEIEHFCELTGKDKYFSAEASIVIARMTKLRQICSGFVRDTESNQTHIFKSQDKLKELGNIIDEINEPVIISVCYKYEIQVVSEMLKRKGISYGEISGNAKDIDREKSRQLFSEGKLDSMIIQEDAGGVGIDGLQKNCSLMIRNSSGYSYDTSVQLIGRLDRSGQTNPIRIISLEAVQNGTLKPTIERSIIETQEEKESGFKDLVENLRRKEIQNYGSRII